MVKALLFASILMGVSMQPIFSEANNSGAVSSKPTIKTGFYRHYRGDLYEVIGVAHHSETVEPLVVYKALYDSKEFGNNALWVRPYTMFLETITIDGVTKPRFEYVGTEQPG
jgi:hypothetical protein